MMTGVERLDRKIEPEPMSGCWIWTGARSAPKGYGNTYLGGQYAKAHRVVYAAVVGPIPHGYTLDHLCRLPCCVNPAHLEPTTMRENNLRGDSLSARRAKMTHCGQGHAFTPENTYLSRRNERSCRTCLRDKDRRRRRTTCS